MVKNDFFNLNCLNFHNKSNVKFIDTSRITLKKKIKAFYSKIKTKKIFKYKISNISDLKKKLLDVDFIFDYHHIIISHKKINNLFENKSLQTSNTVGILAGQLPNFFNHSIIQKFYFLFIFIFYIFKYKKFFTFLKILNKFLLICLRSSKKNYKNYNFSYDYILCDSDITEKIADRYFSDFKKYLCITKTMSNIYNLIVSSIKIIMQFF